MYCNILFDIHMPIAGVEYLSEGPLSNDVLNCSCCYLAILQKWSNNRVCMFETIIPFAK